MSDLNGRTLSDIVPVPELSEYYFLRAIRENDVEQVRKLCLLQPQMVHMVIDEYAHVLPYAFTNNENPDIIKVLLDAGADPNQPPGYLESVYAWYIVQRGFPASTMESFFDAGYKMKDDGTIGVAIREGRVDVVEVMYRRGREQRDAVLPSGKYLMSAVKRAWNSEIVGLAKRLFPEEFRERTGCLAALAKKLYL